MVHLAHCYTLLVEGSKLNTFFIRQILNNKKNDSCSLVAVTSQEAQTVFKTCFKFVCFLF